MSNNNNKKALIKTRVKRRLFYSVVTILLYSSFVLFYTPAWEYFSASFGNSHINLGMLWFIFVIVAFLLLEYLFVFHSDDNHSE